MNVEVEALILEMRRAHPTWGPRTILSRLARQGIDPLPGRSSVHRALVRHGFIDPKRRRRRRSDYKRWERARAMELWQMDITGGVRLADGTEASIVTGIDDYSRFCVSAKVVARATARPVCDALGQAMVAHGVPEAILSDNGKVFTGRFGPSKGEVLFDRICRENGIRHLLTTPQPDHHGQGRAIPQDHEARVPRRQGLRVHRGGPERPRRLGQRVQPRAGAPEPGRPASCRALRPGPLRARGARGGRGAAAGRAGPRRRPG